MRRPIRESDDTRRHNDQPRYLDGDSGGTTGDLLVQPDKADADGYQGVGDRPDCQDRGYEGALLEGILVKQETDRLGDDERIERPLL